MYMWHRWMNVWCCLVIVFVHVCMQNLNISRQNVQINMELDKHYMHCSDSILIRFGIERPFHHFNVIYIYNAKGVLAENGHVNIENCINISQFNCNFDGRFRIECGHTNDYLFSFIRIKSHPFSVFADEH